MPCTADVARRVSRRLLSLSASLTSTTLGALPSDGLPMITTATSAIRRRSLLSHTRSSAVALSMAVVKIERHTVPYQYALVGRPYHLGGRAADASHAAADCSAAQSWRLSTSNLLHQQYGLCWYPAMRCHGSEPRVLASRLHFRGPPVPRSISGARYAEDAPG